MDFSFTSEQDMLRDTVAKLIAQQYDFDTRRKIAKSDAGWRPEMWAQFAELGLLGAAFSEAEGGFGNGPIENMIVMEEFGKGLVIEPYLQTVVIGGNFLRCRRHRAQRKNIPHSSAARDLSRSPIPSRRPLRPQRRLAPPRRRKAPVTC
jgi:alkylation response protein AidB-like acyl-CoA dehydrogenase